MRRKAFGYPFGSVHGWLCSHDLGAWNLVERMGGNDICNVLGGSLKRKVEPISVCTDPDDV